MFENHMLQMYDTREVELRSRLSQRRVELVPPFRSTGDGVVSHLMAAIRTGLRRLRGRMAEGSGRTVSSVPCP